jgi:hypothetical protein
MTEDGGRMTDEVAGFEGGRWICIYIYKMVLGKYGVQAQEGIQSFHCDGTSVERGAVRQTQARQAQAKFPEAWAFITGSNIR